MEASFWHARWKNGRIGFHNADPHRLLVRHWERLQKPPTRVLAPLAGKSIDLQWLADRGHQVVGVELSEIAVRAFFSERGLAPTVEKHDVGTWFRNGRIELLVADFFDVSHDTLGTIDAVYDRAALSAMPPSMQSRYVEHMSQTAPQAPILLITVEYDSSLRGGPPFPVDEEEVRRLYDANDIDRIDEVDAPLRDLTVVEAAYWVRH